MEPPRPSPDVPPQSRTGSRSPSLERPTPPRRVLKVRTPRGTPAQLPALELPGTVGAEPTSASKMTFVEQWQRSPGDLVNYADRPASRKGTETRRHDMRSQIVNAGDLQTVAGGFSVKDSFCKSFVGIRASMQPIFAGKGAIKERVLSAISTPEYKVHDRYKKSGCFQLVARSLPFEVLTVCVIITNAAWMWFDTDKNHSLSLLQARWYFQAAEHAFCAYYTLEVFVRFMAFDSKCDAFRDRPFLFDSLLVLLMITETWVITLVVVSLGDDANAADFGDSAIVRVWKVLRITRALRLLRLMRACPELMLLAKGMAVAGPSIFWTVVLLVLVIYMFAIAFAEQARQTTVGELYFHTVPGAMSTLLLHGCLGENLPDVARALGAESLFLGGLLVLFVLVTSLTVLNMLIGVFVEVIHVMAAVEKESSAVSIVRDKVWQAIGTLEPSFDGSISEDLFTTMLDEQSVIKALQEVGVDVVELIDVSDVLFDRGDTTTFKDFMEVVLQVRGSNKATLKDIISLRKRLLQEMGRVEQSLRSRRIAVPQLDYFRASAFVAGKEEEV